MTDEKSEQILIKLQEQKTDLQAQIRRLNKPLNDEKDSVKILINKSLFLVADIEKIRLILLSEYEIRLKNAQAKYISYKSSLKKD